jgi:DNA-binding CsgD family transcriptional regulator
MNDMTGDRSTNERRERILSSLSNGLLIIDCSGEVLWMDERARARVNGGLQHLSLPPADAQALGIDCVISSVEVTLDGQRTNLCVLRETGERKESGRDFIAAIEAVLADSSWFTRTIVDKLKAWHQTKQPSARSSDLDLLTQREREILALICEGRSDAEMSRVLKLSQNTVRNHVASLYRKIGVNRRSAAIIWARERAITHQEFMVPRAKPRYGRDQNGQ